MINNTNGVSQDFSSSLLCIVTAVGGYSQRSFLAHTNSTWLILALKKSVEIYFNIYMSALRSGHGGICAFNETLPPLLPFSSVPYFLAVFPTGLRTQE